MTRVSAIVARAQNGVIGRDNQLPWHLPSDLRYFKAVTFGKPVIMGRKTFESIGRPLPGRTNVVVTRQSDWQAPGTQTAASLEAALRIANAKAELDGVDEVMLIGGAQLYRDAASWIDRWYVTEVMVDAVGDAHLDAIDPASFQEVERVPGEPQPGELAHHFIIYDRR